MMRLEDINWTSALQAIRERREAGTGPSLRVVANVESLSALFADDYGAGFTRIRRAQLLDPLNPLHTLRMALYQMRFGQWDTALALCQKLQETMPTFALPIYLRGLATMHQGEFKRAANIAQDAQTAQPAFGLAKFLQADAALRTPGKTAKRLLTGLPRGEAYAPAWADLLVKLAVNGADEGLKLAQQIAADQKALPPQSKARSLATRMLELNGAAADKFETRLSEAPAGARVEDVMLLLAHDAFQKGTASESAVQQVRKLHERFPQRRTIRRLYVCLLTRRAMAEAAAEHYADALRLVERCLRLEPHETIHYQNRAALFTLMREPEAYHDAWFELNRHQYRLALLGEFMPADALRLAKPHRLFAEQARFSSSNPEGRRAQDFGIFGEEIKVRDEGNLTLQTVNQDRIAADPELLRQWIHHRRAELIFSHWALGFDPRRFLLYPDDRRVAKGRFGGLVLCAKALATLVPDEGQLLADRILRRWSSLASRTTAAYDPPPDDPEARSLQHLYVETLSDLALLCISWRPDGRRPELVEELLEFLDAAGPFFDEKTLAAALKDQARPATWAMKMLSYTVNETLGLDWEREHVLTEEQRTHVIEALAAQLLANLAAQTYEAYHLLPDAAQRCLPLLDRARKLDPNNVHYQIRTARYLLIGGFFDDARAHLSLAQRNPKAREPNIAEEIEDLRKFLADRKSDSPGQTRIAGVHGNDPLHGGEDRAADLEQEIQDHPASIQLYEDLARALAAEARFDDALDWCGRAMAQCLQREAQFRARSLHLEVLGLQVLAIRDANLVKLYLKGVHRPALDIIEPMADGVERPYPLMFLLGHCLLALNRPEHAREAFETALDRCDRQIHRAVLRRLAADVDQAYLIVARRAVMNHLEMAAYEEALREAAGIIARLSKPELGFLDLARVHFEAAMARLGTGQNPLARPGSLIVPKWKTALDEAYSLESDLKRARRLLALSREADPTCVQQAELLGHKIEALGAQEAVAATLAKSGELLKQSKFTEALAALDASGPVLASEGRIQRQRALLLLKLERFEEADAAAETQRNGKATGAADFLATYPSLAFRQRMASAVRLIRAGSDDEATRILAGARPKTADESLELGYCRAFCRTMAGYRHRRLGEKAKARQALKDALAEVERHLAAARAAGHARLLELYATLDDDVGGDE